jgi:hypothetical protein
VIRAAFRPLVREARILYFRWALRDMQIKNPQHPDMPEVIVALRDLIAERHARPGYLRSIWRWL